MMDNKKEIACVTGASGFIGSRIIAKLQLLGYTIRVLTRNKCFENPALEMFYGSLEDEEVIKAFLHNADLLFHCAAELRDIAKMWDINVMGTKRLLDLIPESAIKYLCYLSSAGVVGQTDVQLVDETAACNPRSPYERSKWEAEQLASQGVKGCKVVILRPTNVIDETRPGAFALPVRGMWIDRVKVFLKGGECAHIVHAEDVAAAAIYFISCPVESPQCFFVSCDSDTLNTFAGIWALYRAIRNNRTITNVRPVFHLPLIVPHVMRKLWRGRSNRGDVRYSSEKIISKGFVFPLGLKGAAECVVAGNGSGKLAHKVV